MMKLPQQRKRKEANHREKKKEKRAEPKEQKRNRRSIGEEEIGPFFLLKLMMGWTFNF